MAFSGRPRFPRGPRPPEAPSVHPESRQARQQSRPRRALSHVGGVVETGGDPKAADELARALEVESAPPPDITVRGGDRQVRRDDDADRVHVHGFHTYPARMHPATAARMVSALAPAGGVVLDPFCGSGTVLVEAMLAGRDAVGTDLNPLAVELSHLKTRARDAANLDALVAGARAASELATARRKARAGATRRYPPDDMRLFDPHVLLELDGIRAGIDELKDHALRRDLALVLSAILVKVSRKQGDTSEELAPRRIAAGYPSKLFTKKTEELAQRLAAFHGALPSPAPRARVEIDDATKLRALSPHSIDAIVTSPPYVATYDYLAHHTMRMRWLGLDARPFERGELGARRRYAPLAPGDARAAWAAELTALFDALGRVARAGAPLVLLIADSAVGDLALRAEEIVLEVADGSAFEPVARASQARPHFHMGTARAFATAPRREHALLLSRRSLSRSR